MTFTRPFSQVVGQEVIYGKPSLEVEAAPVGTPRSSDLRGRWSHGLDWSVVLSDRLDPYRRSDGALRFDLAGLAVARSSCCLVFSGGLGVCLGFHRLLTHGSFQTFPFVCRLLGPCRPPGGRRSAADSGGRAPQHHQFSDQPGDPHSPREGRWWSHMLWLFSWPREPQYTAADPALWRGPV